MDKTRLGRCWIWSGRNVPGDDAGGADALGPLGDEELASLLDGLVDVVALGGTVGQVVVRDVVELVLLEEVGRDDPGTVLDDLVHPLAVADRLGALGGGHDRQALARVRLVVARDADDEGGVGEGLLGLLELAHVTSSLQSVRCRQITRSGE